MVKSKNQNDPEKLIDQFSRTISYLRLSLTDKCNLRCLYCMPCKDTDDLAEKVYKSLNYKELLTYEELLKIVRVGVSLGMSKLRLTGGEPLLRKGVLGFIELLSKIEGLKQIRLTTNGVLLEEKGEKLYELGVRHLNVSLDSLQKEKFHRITGRDYLDKVMRGITKAIDLGFKIKINVVAMNGINDEEFLSFADFAANNPVQVRFIEFMPIGKGSIWDKSQYIEAGKIKDIVAKKYILSPISRSKIEGPAKMFEIIGDAGEKGRVGFISPISHHFCDQCNRLRLTSEGKLRACLLNDGETDLKTILRSGGTDDDIEKAIRDVILFKPKGHNLAGGSGERATCQVRMSRIGG